MRDWTAAHRSTVVRYIKAASVPTQPGVVPGVTGSFRFIKSEFSGASRHFKAAAAPAV
jgi:hypothetical protein